MLRILKKNTVQYKRYLLGGINFSFIRRRIRHELKQRVFSICAPLKDAFNLQDSVEPRCPLGVQVRLIFEYFPRAAALVGLHYALHAVIPPPSSGIRWQSELNDEVALLNLRVPLLFFPVHRVERLRRLRRATGRRERLRQLALEIRF